MTRTLWDFPGGVHPPEHKAESNQTPIQNLPLPPQLVIPLQQHIGTMAKPMVEVGQRVLGGAELASASGYVSVPVHAPTSGVITAIEPRPVQHPSGLPGLCAILEPDGKDEWLAADTELPPYRERARDQVLEQIRASGIAGMGGAGFPTAVKLHLNRDQRIEHLILNAVECEPYITADDRLMQEAADAVIEGLAILAWLIEPASVLIGIEDNKPAAITAMRDAIQRQRHTAFAPELVVIPTKYPSGGEKQLIQILTGKEVRSGGLPADVGVVCQNVGTAYAVRAAVIEQRPLVDRITTVTGQAVQRPGNYRVRLGTPVNWLLQQCGWERHRSGRLLMGGPMMGFAIQETSVPIVKTSNCVLAPGPSELASPAAEQPCIRCGECANVCPASLLPQQLYWFARARELEKAAHFNLADCIECGACAYVCPSQIPLVQYYRATKGAIRQQEQETRKSDHARSRFEARNARLAREEAEKERRREERARAAAAKQAEKKKQAANGSAVASAATTDPLAVLQTKAASTMKRYKDAQKALLAAEKSDAGADPKLSAKVEQLKAKADAAKAELKAARAAPATASNSISKGDDA